MAEVEPKRHDIFFFLTDTAQIFSVSDNDKCGNGERYYHKEWVVAGQDKVAGRKDQDANNTDTSCSDTGQGNHAVQIQHNAKNNQQEDEENR